MRCGGFKKKRCKQANTRFPEPQHKTTDLKLLETELRFTKNFASDGPRTSRQSCHYMSF